MDEVLKEKYKEYLFKQLDLIFNSENGEVIENSFASSAVGCPMFTSWYNFLTDEHMMAYKRPGEKMPMISLKTGTNYCEGFTVIKDKYVLNYESEIYGNHPKGLLGFCKILDSNGNYLALKAPDGKRVDEFREAYNFSEGYAYVEYKTSKKDSLHKNFIDYDGNLLFDYDLDYEFIGSFHNGYALVKKVDGQYNFIDKEGKLLFENEWLYEANSFSEGVAWVQSKDGKYYYIDTNGERISSFFDKVESFNCGWGLVFLKNIGYNYVNKKGSFLSGEWFKQATNFQGGVATVSSLAGDKRHIDTNGNTIRLEKTQSMYYVNDSATAINDERDERIFRDFKYRYYFRNMDLGGYSVKTYYGRYNCKGPKDSFIVKYRPIRIYGRYVLCFDKKWNELHVYDRKTKTIVKELGKTSEVEFNKNFIYKKYYNRLYLMYNDQMIDITEYFFEKLRGKKNISIAPNIELLDINDFQFKYGEDIDEALSAKKEEKKSIIEESEYLETTSKLEDLEELERKRKERVKQRYLEAKGKYSNTLDECLPAFAEYEEEFGLIDRVAPNGVFINVGDHLEIRKEIIEKKWLKYINFAGLTFKNVKVEGLDFRGCNVDSLVPQGVYGMSLKGCDFTEIYFPLTAKFKGVNICGAKFTSDKNALTFDINVENLLEGTYDDETTFDGKKLSDLKKERDNSRKEFTYSLEGKSKEEIFYTISKVFDDFIKGNQENTLPFGSEFGVKFLTLRQQRRDIELMESLDLSNISYEKILEKMDELLAEELKRK